MAKVSEYVSRMFCSLEGQQSTLQININLFGVQDNWDVVISHNMNAKIC